MPRYYFHLEDGQVLLDDTGLELRDIAAAQNEALLASGNIIRLGLDATATLWKGTPLRMWVTDKPNGEGNTFFTLLFSAEMASAKGKATAARYRQTANGKAWDGQISALRKGQGGAG
jgi:hypothetical protein